MREKGQPCAIVLRQGKPFGMVTERDVTWKVAAEGLDPKNVKIEKIMSTPLISVEPDVDMIEAAKIMKNHKIRRLAVVRQGVLRGVITASDVATHCEVYADKEIEDALKFIWTPQYFPEQE